MQSFCLEHSAVLPVTLAGPAGEPRWEMPPAHTLAGVPLLSAEAARRGTVLLVLFAAAEAVLPMFLIGTLLGGRAPGAVLPGPSHRLMSWSPPRWAVSLALTSLWRVPYGNPAAPHQLTARGRSEGSAEPPALRG